ENPGRWNDRDPGRRAFPVDVHPQAGFPFDRHQRPIQYTLAIDRSDDTVAHLYDPLHPAVLNLVAHIIRSANRVNVPVAVCGEMAGDVRLTRVLLGFGLRQFSMHPAYLLSVKQQVLKSDLQEVIVYTQKML